MQKKLHQSFAVSSNIVFLSIRAQNASRIRSIQEDKYNISRDRKLATIFKVNTDWKTLDINDRKESTTQGISTCFSKLYKVLERDGLGTPIKLFKKQLILIFLYKGVQSDERLRYSPLLSQRLLKHRRIPITHLVTF